MTLATEHAAVFETVKDLGRLGFEAIVLPVEPDGLVEVVLQLWPTVADNLKRS